MIIEKKKKKERTITQRLKNYIDITCDNDYSKDPNITRYLEMLKILETQENLSSLDSIEIQENILKTVKDDFKESNFDEEKNRIIGQIIYELNFELKYKSSDGRKEDK